MYIPSGCTEKTVPYVCGGKRIPYLPTCRENCPPYMVCMGADGMLSAVSFAVKQLSYEYASDSINEAIALVDEMHSIAQERYGCEWSS